MRGRWNAGLVLVAVVVAILAAWASPAAAADATLTVSPSPVPLSLTLGSILNTADTLAEATATVFVVASSPTTASVSGVDAHGTDLSLTSPPELRFSTAGSATVQVSMETSATGPSTGWLVFSDESSNTVAVPYQLRVDTPAAVLGQVCGYSAACAAAIVLLVAGWLWGTRKKEKEKAAPATLPPPSAFSVIGGSWASWLTTLGKVLRKEKLDDDDPVLSVAGETTWSFQDNWATNLTAAGAILGTILATSGFLAEVLPKVSIGVFLGFNLLYLFLVPLAPLVFHACSTKDGPSFLGLVLAGAVTLWATLGELATALVLFMRGGMAWYWTIGVLVVAVMMLSLYCLASFRAATDDDPDWIDGPAAATTAAGVTTALGTMNPFYDRERVKIRAIKAAQDVLLVAGKRPPRETEAGAGAARTAARDGAAVLRFSDLEPRKRSRRRTSVLL